MTFEAGKVVKLTETIAVTLGKVVTINPVGFPEPVSGAVIPVEGPCTGVVVGACLAGVPLRPRADVKLLAPGSSNNNRIVSVFAGFVAD
jgi:hypothetical protein